MINFMHNLTGPDQRMASSKYCVLVVADRIQFDTKVGRDYTNHTTKQTHI